MSSFYLTVLKMPSNLDLVYFPNQLFPLRMRIDTFSVEQSINFFFRQCNKYWW